MSIPAGAPVNKDTFREPPGLRRAFDEFRDRDRMILRGKVDQAIGQAMEMQAQLRRSEAEVARLSGRPVRPHVITDEVQSLKKQIAELNNRILVANQAFSAGRKQHDAALDKLRHDLEAARADAQRLEREKAELAEQLRVTAAELDRQRQLSFTAQNRARSGHDAPNGKSKRHSRSRRH
jgi:cation diffusion facilitator CzcD-associated flavoprotein CzcO